MSDSKPEPVASGTDTNAPPVPIVPGWAYWFGRFATGLELRLWHRLRIEGAERVPARGGVLLVSNHQSFLDIPILANSLRRHVVFLARESLARSGFLAWIMRESRAILIRQGAGDRSALRSMVQALRAEGVVAVFPEGTRTKTGELGAFRGGTALVLRQAPVPVVPVAIEGAYEAFGRHKRFPSPHRIRVRFGEPLAAGSENAMERAHERVAELLAELRAGR